MQWPLESGGVARRFVAEAQWLGASLIDWTHYERHMRCSFFRI
jgi:hypothetical protein